MGGKTGDSDRGKIREGRRSTVGEKEMERWPGGGVQEGERKPRNDQSGSGSTQFCSVPSQ